VQARIIFTTAFSRVIANPFISSRIHYVLVTQSSTVATAEFGEACCRRLVL